MGFQGNIGVASLAVQHRLQPLHSALSSTLAAYARFCLTGDYAPGPGGAGSSLNYHAHKPIRKMPHMIFHINPLTASTTS